MSALLDVAGVTRAFDGRTVVDGVSFSVAAGEAVALIGPNGAGKTTCFNIIGGQLAADAGRVRLDGRDVLGLRPGRLARRGVGRTFQTAAAFPSLGVRANVQAALLARRGGTLDPVRAARRRHRAEADALLARVGLSALADRPAGVLAYGDLKRLDLALALAAGPRLLLMDEPTAGTAPDERHALMALVDGLVRDDGLAVLFTEHDMDVVFGHAHRVVVLADGRAVASGLPERVRLDPTVRAVYLGGDSADAAEPSSRYPESPPA